MKRDEWINKINEGHKLSADELSYVDKMYNYPISANFSKMYKLLFELKSDLKNDYKNALISSPHPRAIIDMLGLKNFKIFKTKIDEANFYISDWTKENTVDEFIFDKNRNGKYDLIFIDPFYSKPFDEKITSINSFIPHLNPSYFDHKKIIKLFKKNLSENGVIILFDHNATICSSKNGFDINGTPKISKDDVLFFGDNIPFKFPRASLHEKFKSYFKPYLSKIISVENHIKLIGHSLYDDNLLIIKKNISYRLDLMHIGFNNVTLNSNVEKSNVDLQDFWCPGSYLLLEKQYGYQKHNETTRLSEISQLIQGKDWLKRLYELGIIEEVPEHLVHNSSEDNNENDYFIVNDFDVYRGSLIGANDNVRDITEQEFSLKVNFDFNEFIRKATQDFKEDVEISGGLKEEILEDIPDEKSFLLQKGDLCISLDGRSAMIINNDKLNFLVGLNILVIRSEYNNFLLDLLTSNNGNNVLSYYFKTSNISDTRDNLISFYDEIKIPLFNDITELENILTYTSKPLYQSKLESYLHFNFNKIFGWSIEVDELSQSNNFYYLSVKDKRVSFFILSDFNDELSILDNIPNIDYIFSRKGFVISPNGKCWIFNKKKLSSTLSNHIMSPNELFPGEYEEIILENASNAGEKYLIHLIKKLSSSQEHNFQKIENKLTGLSKDIDKIIVEIKNIDEKLPLIYNVIEKTTLNIEMSNYINKVKSWFEHWDLLEPESKNFMPRSEYLLENIEKSDFGDYSPFILYYCRALEYELLQKIFIKFHEYLDSNYPDKNKLFEYDKEKVKAKTIKDIEEGMMKSFKNKIMKNNFRYTLGDMRLLLDLLPTRKNPKGKDRYQALMVLKELSKFINEKIGVIPSQLIEDIAFIIIDYRNPSAHVGLIEKEKADDFKRKYIQIMNELIGLFR